MANLKFFCGFTEDLAAIGAFHRHEDTWLKLRDSFSGQRTHKVRVIAGEHRAMSEQVKHRILLQIAPPGER